MTTYLKERAANETKPRSLGSEPRESIAKNRVTSTLITKKLRRCLRSTQKNGTLHGTLHRT